jgi:hypothetical protein
MRQRREYKSTGSSRKCLFPISSIDSRCSIPSFYSPLAANLLVSLFSVLLFFVSEILAYTMSHLVTLFLVYAGLANAYTVTNAGFLVHKNIDPIVFPGQYNKSHLHSFFGSDAVTINTTPRQNCSRAVPQLLTRMTILHIVCLGSNHPASASEMASGNDDRGSYTNG